MRVAFCLAVLVGVLAVPASGAKARPDLVREVSEGKRHEARASWWGFDEADSTEALQAAINSRVRKLIIDRQTSDWVTRPLTGGSDQEVVFESGTRLVAKAGEYRGRSESLLTFSNCKNVTLRGQTRDGGKSVALRMRKKDYQQAPYDKSEWRHGISLLSCRNVLVQDISIRETGGDGIYLGVSYGKGPNRNVTIRRVDCSGNHRQGISVISAQGLLIDSCRLRDTSGTAPQAGIDFEPNSPDESLVRCVMRDCVLENNAGSGVLICPQMMNSRSAPISLQIIDCTSRNNRQHAIHFVTATADPPRGLLRVSDFDSSNDAMSGLSVQFNPFDAVRIEMTDSVLRGNAVREKLLAPIYLQSSSDHSRPIGGLHFSNVTIKDEEDRPFIRIVDRKGNGVRDITGSIILDRGGKSTAYTIDSNWLETYPAWTRPAK